MMDANATTAYLLIIVVVMSVLVVVTGKLITLRCNILWALASILSILASIQKVIGILLRSHSHHLRSLVEVQRLSGVLIYAYATKYKFR